MRQRVCLRRHTIVKKQATIPKGAITSVDEYIATQNRSARPMLKRVRKAIRQAVPAAEEMILYGMPTYKLAGRRLLAFALWRQHLALYGSTRPLVAEFKELRPDQIEKGTVRFPLPEPPTVLIGRIARFRV